MARHNPPSGARLEPGRSRATTVAVKKRTVAISLGLGAVLLVWAAVFFSHSGEQPAPALPPIEPPEEVAQPSAQDASLAPRVAPAAAAEPVATPATAPSQDRPAADPPSSSQRARPERMGPIDELEAAYQSDVRDPEAGEAEERIRGQLEHEDIPAELLRRVSCVKSVCKLELRWTSDDNQAYMIAMMSLVSNISQKVAATPVGEDHGEDAYPIDVYVSRIEPPYKLPAGSQPE